MSSIPSIAHAVALGENDKVYAWGYNHKGQLGRNYVADKDYYAPSPVLARGGNGTLSGAVDIAAAMNSSAILLGDGSIWVFGENDKGAAGYRLRKRI